MSDDVAERSARQALILLIPDLFFSVKVADVARALGYQTREVANADALVAAAREGIRGVVLDTQERSDWQAAVRTLKSDPATASVPILAFGSHVDVAATRAAVAAGCDRLVTRGKFSQELPQLLQSLFVPTSDSSV
jgi:CheY-like chemotaxis protein